MDANFLEQYYEKVILPLYSSVATFKNVTWKDHGQVGNDAYAHYFDDENGREYVLLYEDFPGGDYLNDDLTHDILPYKEETSVKVSIESAGAIDNIAGYFTLYQEKRKP